MDYTLEIITPAAAPLVSLNKAKSQCRVERSETYDDDFLVDLIEEATEMVEDEADLTFLPKTYRMTLPRFPKDSEDAIYLPRPPLVMVDSIAYFDANGDQQSLDDSQFSAGQSSSIWMDIGHTWPKTRRRKHAVIIEYQSGSAKPPARARRAILLTVAQWYADREGERELPATVLALIEQLRPGDEFTRVA